MKYFYPYKLDDKFWVYDRYSNKISEIDLLTYRIFSSFYKHKFDENKAALYLKDYADEKIIIQKVKEIKRYQKEHNIFKIVDIEKCVMPVTEDELIYKYNNEIRHIIFNLTDDCNLRCKYCKFGGTYTGVKTHKKNSMSYDVINAAIKFIEDYYKNNETLIVSFYGGEPLLEFKKIKYIVDKINSKYKDFRFAFTTNGILLNTNNINFFIKNNFSIKISLDGPKLFHDRNRITKTGKGSFEIIEKKIETIKRIDINYFKKKVGFVLTIAPPYDLIELLNFFEENTYITQPIIISFVDPIGTNFFNNYDMEYENEKLKEQHKILLSEYYKAKEKGLWNLRVKILDEFYGKNLYEMDKRYIYPLDKNVSPNGACFPGLDRLFISTNGSLSMCEKVNDNLPFGDVYNGIDIERVKEIYNGYCELINNVCLDCWAYRLCKSCYNGAIEDGKLSVKQKQVDCKFKKRAATNNLIRYTKIKMLNKNIFETHLLSEN